MGGLFYEYKIWQKDAERGGTVSHKTVRKGLVEQWDWSGDLNEWYTWTICHLLKKCPRIRKHQLQRSSGRKHAAIFQDVPSGFVDRAEWGRLQCGCARHEPDSEGFSWRWSGNLNIVIVKRSFWKFLRKGAKWHNLCD